MAVIMVNPNKRKGDKAERDVRDYLQTFWPDTFKTKAGFNDDLGDVIARAPFGRLVVQVKDVANPNWKKWYQQLGSQVDAATTAYGEFTSREVVAGGVIVHKLRGTSNVGMWRAVVPLASLRALLETVYEQGRMDAMNDIERGK